MGGKIMHPLEQEIQALNEAYENGDIDRNERDYLLLEIRDIRAAQECAGDEQLARQIFQACNIAMAVI
jgi:hypothetical protein